MSVSVQVPYKKYTAAPAATLFPTTFRVVLASDLQVTVDGVVVTSGFTLSTLGQPSGVDVTFTAPMVGGEVVELQRIIPKSRTNDYQQLGDFNAATVNADIDRVWMSVQEVGEQVDRAVKVPIGSAIDPDELVEDLLEAEQTATAAAGAASASASAAAASAAASIAAAPLLLQSVAGVNTVTASTTPATTAYSTGQLFKFIAVNDNTGAMTINVDGTGPAAMTKNGTEALAAGDVMAGQAYLLLRDAVGNFQLSGGSGGGATAGGIFYECGQTLLDDYTIPANTNAISGQLAIATGKTLTISTGAVWSQV